MLKEKRRGVFLMSEALEKKTRQMMPLLNEKQLRRYLGSEAEVLGHGRIGIVSRISGKARNTIVAGMKENKNKEIDTVSHPYTQRAFLDCTGGHR